jgi:hypothetical protein
VVTVYDPNRDRAVMFGGYSVGLTYPDVNDTWFLTFGGGQTVSVLALVSVQSEPGRVLLSWYSADAAVLEAALERRTTLGDWQTIARIVADGSGHLAYEDTQVRSGERYGYRLRIAAGGAQQYSSVTWVDVPKVPRLALAGLQPNPTSSRVSVAFTLPDDASARLQLIDINGRRVLDRSLAGFGPGPHVLDLADARVLPPGIYFVRLSHGAEALTARGVIMR